MALGQNPLLNTIDMGGGGLIEEFGLLNIVARERGKAQRKKALLFSFVVCEKSSYSKMIKEL